MSPISSRRADAASPIPLHALRWLWLSMLALVLGGCSVFWVSGYDKDAIDRITEISKSSLKFYQDLLAMPPEKREAAIAGPLGKTQGDIDSQVRLHLLREQARAKNTEGARVAKNLLESWEVFTASHASGEPDALGDAKLVIERQVIERHLGAAFVAEEARKPGGAADKSTPT